MQKTISFLLIGAVILSVMLCSCDRSSDDELTTDNNDKIIVAADKSVPITSGNLITKTKTQGDDVIVDFYDSNSNLVEEFVWADGETQKQHIVYTYTQSNKVSSKTELSPGGENMIATAYQYNSEDVLLQKTVSEYADGLLSKSTTYDSEDNVTGYSLSHYNTDSRLEKVERFDSDENLVEYFKYEYEENGKTSKYSAFTASGELIKYSLFIYNDNGELSQEKYFNSDDELESYYEFDYYDNGEMKESTHYDADGNILSQDFFDDSRNP